VQRADTSATKSLKPVTSQILYLRFHQELNLHAVTATVLTTATRLISDVDARVEAAMSTHGRNLSTA
jgi:hypothetical protein